MINIENLSKSFGGHIIFENASFMINPRERVGLVGRNGHGKTTLFRLITGDENYDSGTIIIPKHYRIGYVHQQISFTKDTVLEEAATGLVEQERDHYWKVEKILSGLGFSASDMQCHPGQFSGGYQVRLNLAKTLISEPDLLLLDEPTNYLDITSTRWVERFLSNWPRELILITHDRSFMDKLISHTVGIHRKKIRKVTGNTEKYYSQIAQEEEIYEKTRINDEKRQKEIDQFITRFRAKARLANLVQSRVKTLSKMEKNTKLEQIKTLDFSFQSLPFQGKHVLIAENISFAYDKSIPVIKDFNITVAPGDRICVVGKNGMGKTTLLKLLAGSLVPESGKTVYNPSTIKGYFEQTNIKRLVPTRTVEEEILYSHPDIERQAARNICGAMMFEGNDALKKIGVLSGGEKSRVMLGKLIVTPVNLLLLDEPTNHLDMESTDAMLAAIDNFKGAVIMVTHNEMFLHALARRLVVFKKKGIDVFEGSYQRFLEKEGWEEETEQESSKKDIGKFSKKELKQMRSKFFTERAKILKPISERISVVEKNIETREKQLDDFTQAMQQASQDQKGKKIEELSRSIHSCGSDIDRLFDELEKLTVKLDLQNEIFDERLRHLENGV